MQHTKASYATTRTTEKMHFHSNEHQVSDDRKTKNLNTEKTDAHISSYNLMVPAWAIKIFTMA